MLIRTIFSTSVCILYLDFIYIDPYDSIFIYDQRSPCYKTGKWRMRRPQNSGHCVVWALVHSRLLESSEFLLASNTKHDIVNYGENDVFCCVILMLSLSCSFHFSFFNPVSLSSEHWDLTLPSLKCPPEEATETKVLLLHV